MKVIEFIWHWLTKIPKDDRGMISIIIWWEARRIPYNLIVGGFALINLFCFLSLIIGSGCLKAGEDAVEPMALIAAPLAINICYTWGWIAEIIILMIRKRDDKLGKLLFIIGISFSLLLITVPSVFWAIKRIGLFFGFSSC